MNGTLEIQCEHAPNGMGWCTGVYRSRILDRKWYYFGNPAEQSRLADHFARNTSAVCNARNGRKMLK